MKQGIIHLPNSELELMMAIWNINAPVTRKDIEAHLIGNKWAPTTILKFLSRLTEKGFLSCEAQADGKKNIYTALISEEDYLKSECDSTFGKFAGNSVSDLVAYLYQNDTINNKDIEELKEYIDSIK